MSVAEWDKAEPSERTGSQCRNRASIVMKGEKHTYGKLCLGNSWGQSGDSWGPSGDCPGLSASRAAVRALCQLLQLPRKLLSTRKMKSLLPTPASKAQAQAPDSILEASARVASCNARNVPVPNAASSWVNDTGRISSGH